MAGESSNVWVDMLGENLVNGSKSVETAEALNGKTVGLYFSAHWCPPCRGFTPVLAKAYSDHYKAKDLEIVFVSSDQEQSGFDSYYGEMPWLALPFDQRDTKAAVAKKFGVSGIPMLVIIDSDGNTITLKGRGKVNNDLEGKNFPGGWKD